MAAEESRNLRMDQGTSAGEFGGRDQAKGLQVTHAFDHPWRIDALTLELLHNLFE